MATRPFGNIRRLRSGRYQARYTGPTGKQHSGGTFTSKKAARLWLAEQEQSVKRGKWVDPQAGEITFDDYVDLWWKTKTRLAPSTQGLYEGFLKKHIRPTFGSKKLVAITKADIKRWYTYLVSKAGLSHNSAAKIYVLLRQILRAAVEDERLFRNPCDIKGAGTEHVSERRIPTVEQVTRIVEVIGEEYRPMVELAAFVGLRFGELAGLQRKHFNPLLKQLTVEQQLDQNAKDHLAFRPPKTDAGRRTLVIPDTLVEHLEAHIARFRIVGPDELLFTSPTGGPLDRHNFRMRKWLPALDRVDVPHFRFHDLRHLAGTLSAASGASLKTIMGRLGHSSVAAALVYQHVMQRQDEQLAQHINRTILDSTVPRTAVGGTDS
jgi:integrase